MRSTPLSGSTFSMERAVCSVIFLIVSGRASPYSDMIKSHVFGGALTILIVIFGYFAVSILSPSQNHSLSRSVRWGGAKFTIFTSRRSASSRISPDCFLVILLEGAVMLKIGRLYLPESTWRYIASTVSKKSKSTERSIPSHHASFARENTLSSPYPVRDLVERRNMGESDNGSNFDRGSFTHFSVLFFLIISKFLNVFRYLFYIQ